MFGNKLRELRENANESRKDLARLIGVSVSAISNYENNIRKPEVDSVWKKIAIHYGVSVDYLMGVENIKQTIEDKEHLSIDLTTVTKDTVSLPILGSVAAGTGAYCDNDIIGYEEIPMSWINQNEDYVILKVSGDSMYPKFEDGDCVLVKIQTSIDSGDYGIVLIEGDNSVIKKVNYGNDWVELVSVNPMYPPRRFEKHDLEQLRVFGLVKKSWRNY